MSIKKLLKDEFKNFHPSGSAWDACNSKNILSRDILGIISDAKVTYTSIGNGNAGKYYWINKADGTTVSGNMENHEIWEERPFGRFEKVNYNMIEFALIPVDDF